MKRGALFCPGRGAYTKRTRGTLPKDHPWTARAEELRKEYGLPSLLELDHETAWRGAIHLSPDNVSPLIWLVSMLDAEEAKRTHDIVCVGGNSMGWYTALAVAGAVDFDDGFRLMQEMSILQMEHAEGGQMLYPLIDDQWRIDPQQVRRVEEALASSGGEAYPSIELGGYAVLAGTEKGMAHLETALPFVEMGPSLYPQRLKLHGPYHTPLLEPVAARARAQLARLAWRAPAIPLVDGRGAVFSPWSADPGEVRDYTLGAQIATPYRFTRSVRVAMREFAPDVLVLPGPGNTLGGICAQVLIAEGWGGLRSREDFEKAQEGETPVIWSMRR